MIDNFSKEDFNRYYRYCISLVKDKDEAFDLLQTGFEKFLASSADNKKYPKAYLYRILRNQFIDQQRKLARWKTDSLDDDGAGKIALLDIESLNDQVESQEQVERIFNALEARDRELLYLWAVEGYSVKEIAEKLTVPQGTLLSRLHRLKKRLRSFLNNEQPQRKSNTGT